MNYLNTFLEALLSEDEFELEEELDS